MPTLRKATQAEKQVYANSGHKVYPLYGYVTLDGVWCAVEDLRGVGGKDEPKYEVMAPEGFHFRYAETHSILCLKREEVFQAANDRLVKCHSRCY